MRWPRNIDRTSKEEAGSQKWVVQQRRTTRSRASLPRQAGNCFEGSNILLEATLETAQCSIGAGETERGDGTVRLLCEELETSQMIDNVGEANCFGFHTRNVNTERSVQNPGTLQKDRQHWMGSGRRHSRLSSFLMKTAMGVDNIAAKVLEALPWRVVQTTRRPFAPRYLGDSKDRPDEYALRAQWLVSSSAQEWRNDMKFRVFSSEGLCDTLTLATAMFARAARRH